MEDTGLWPFVIANTKQYVDVPKRLYCYFQRDDSLLHTPNADRYMPSLLHVMIKYKNAVEKDPIYEDIYLSSVRCVFGYVSLAHFKRWRGKVVAVCKQNKIHRIVKNTTLINSCINIFLSIAPTAFLSCVSILRSFYMKHCK